MTRKKRRTEIKIETHEVKVVRLKSKSSLALCGRCGEIVTALTPEQTAEILEMTRDDVFRLVEGARIHLVNADRGLPIICGNSFGDGNEIVTQKALTTSF